MIDENQNGIKLIKFRKPLSASPPVHYEQAGKTFFPKVTREHCTWNLTHSDDDISWIFNAYVVKKEIKEMRKNRKTRRREGKYSIQENERRNGEGKEEKGEESGAYLGEIAERRSFQCHSW